jgi:hypothetical protein
MYIAVHTYFKSVDIHPLNTSTHNYNYYTFSFMLMFCRSLFVLLYFFFWPLCCLFFDIRILITPLISSNSSYIFLGCSPDCLSIVYIAVHTYFKSVDIHPLNTSIHNYNYYTLYNVLLCKSNQKIWMFAGTAHPFGAPEFTPVSSGVRDTRSLALC